MHYTILYNSVNTVLYHITLYPIIPKSAQVIA